MAVKIAESAQKCRISRVSGNTGIFFRPNIMQKYRETKQDFSIFLSPIVSAWIGSQQQHAKTDWKQKKKNAVYFKYFLYLYQTITILVTGCNNFCQWRHTSFQNRNLLSSHWFCGLNDTGIEIRGCPPAPT